jgi:DNA-binding response OmpR family regulator
MQQPLIWLVEDEISIAETLIYMLNQEGGAVNSTGICRRRRKNVSRKVVS